MKQLISVLLVTLAFSLTAMSQNTTPTKGGPNATPTKGGPNAAPTNVGPSNTDPKGHFLPGEGEVDGYVIGPEDVLSIVVFKEEQLSTKVTVRADGKISLLLLDEVQAGGRTPVQLKETITQGLKKFLTDPQVFVIPVEIHSQYVYIVGAVGKPGVYPLGGSLRVTELLVRAGGLSDFAKSEQIVIVREQGTLKTRLPFNYKSFLQGKNFKQDIQLQSHDMVIVP
jgi:polysaccharide export outer membrane protein